MSRQGLDRLIGRWRNQGGDWGKFRGMDLVDREVDGPHQQILRSMVEHSGDRVEQVVFDLLTEGKQHQGEEAAYREAVDRLIRERPAESPPPDAGEHFDERGYLVDSAGNILFHEGPTQARPAARPAAGPGESPGVYGLIATIRKLLDVTNYTEARVPGSETAQAAALLRERATVTQKMQAGNWRIALEEAVHLLSARTGFEADPARLPEGVAEGFRQFFGPGKPLDARAVLEGLGQWAVRRAEGSLQGLTAEQVAAARHAEAWARESGALEALDRIGHLARAEEGGPATRQAAGMIGRGAEPALTQGERARSAWERLRDWFQDNVTDNLAVLRRAGMDKAHTLYSRLMFAERSTAQEFAERGVWTVRDGKKEYIGPALEAITRGLLPEDLAPHQGEVSKASVFAIARHVIWEAEHAGMLAPPHPNATRTIKSGPAQGEAIWEAQARPTVSPEQLEVYRRAMAEFQKDPQFARRATAFADRLTQAYNATRRALASPDVHRLDPAVVEYYEKLYPHYVPLERVLEPGGWRERQGVRGENMPKVFHQRTGSGEQIVDPLVSYQKRLQVTAAMLHEQLRRNAWAEYLLEPGHGDYGIPFETGEQALTPYGKVSKRQLENIGLPDHEVANILREMGGTAYMQEYAPWPKDGTRPTVEWYGPGGKRMDFRIGDRAFYDLVTGQQGESNSAAQFFRWMGKLGFDTPWGRFEPLSQSAGLVRKGATAFSLGFQVRNALSPFRDPYEFLKNTSDRASVARLPEMLKRAYSYEAQVAMGRVPADEVFALFVRERGEAQRQFATEVPTLSGRAELLGQILEKGRRVLNTLGAGELAPRFLEFVNRLGQRGWSERRIIEETRKAQEAARIGEYYRDPVPWDVLQDAMEAANEVTVPFNRQGVVTREINKLVPFFGPQVAGMSKAIRNWRTNPAGAAIGLGAVLTLRLMHWLAFHDQDWYGELQAHDRYNNFVVPVPGLGLRRIPGPRDLEVPVGGFLTALLDAVGKKHPDFAGLVSQSAGAILPPPPIPPALAVTWQVGTNRDWTGRPIVPRGDEQAPGAYNLLHHQGPYALGQLTGGRGELSLRGTGLVPFSQVRDANRSVVELYDRLHSMEWERQKARRQGVVYPREAEYQRLYHAAHEVSRLGQEERGLTHQGRSLREGPQPAAGRQEQIRRQQAQLAQQALR